MAVRSPSSLTLTLLSVRADGEVSQECVTVSSINSANNAKPTPNNDSQESFMAISFAAQLS